MILPLSKRARRENTAGGRSGKKKKKGKARKNNFLSRFLQDLDPFQPSLPQMCLLLIIFPGISFK